MTRAIPAPADPSWGRGVRLATVHRVKGLEWPHVIVLSATEGLMPHRLAGDVEEERRVFHVALTRCSESVLMVADGPKSSFITEMSWRSKLKPEDPLASPVQAREASSIRRTVLARTTRCSKSIIEVQEPAHRRRSRAGGR